jgi:hypothetical protein
MLNVYLCVSFGYEPDAEVWATSVEVPRELYLGDATNIKLVSEETENVYIIECEVAHIGETDEGNEYAYAFNNEPIENLEVKELLETSGWTLLEREDADNVIDTIDAAPPVAATHDLILAVGDYTQLDESGYPSTVQMWHRIVEPSDVSVPLFGEKFFSHIIMSNNELSDGEEIDISDMSDEEVEELIEEIRANGVTLVNKSREEEDEDDPYFNPDEIIIDKVSGEPLEHFIEFIDNNHDEPMRFYIEEQLTLEEEGSPEAGYPVLVFYTAKTGYGVASIGAWLKDLSEYTELDMIADGWELLGKDSLNLEEFRLKERIDIAKQTHLIMMFDDYDNRYVHEYSLSSPETVTKEQFILIPPALQEFIEGINEMNSEIDSIDSIVSGWMEEESSDGGQVLD